MPSRGPKVLEIFEYTQKNTTEISDLTAGKLAEFLMDIEDEVPYAIGVDTIGLGRGVYDQLINIQRIQKCYPIDVSEKPLDEQRFHRLRDEMWWQARESFVEQRTPVIPNDDELIAELTSIKWKEVNGKIKVESKPDLRHRGLPSPNKGDAFCMTRRLLRQFVSRMPMRARRTVRRRGLVGPGSWKTV